jgi:glycerol-3-phosphate dehydrogenase
LIPGFKDARALRVWTGVRPLFEDRKQHGSSDTRDVTRAHALLDHQQRDGVSGFLTIVGGKLTTYRLMAQETVDAVCHQLGDWRPCTTATERLPGSEHGDYYHVGERLARREQHLFDDQLVCECELISRRQFEDSIRRRGTTDLDDIRRLLRLGMGPCQGGFCVYRAAGILHGLNGIDTSQANAALLDYVRERWKGVWPILYGDQLRQARFDEWVFQGMLDIEHLP